MKMIMAILHKDDELETIEELNIAGYMVTKLATTGGFLKKKSTTIMVVVDDEKVCLLYTSPSPRDISLMQTRH